MAKRNVVVGVKDLGGLAVLKDVVFKLSKLCAELDFHWVAEGLAARALTDAGIPIVGGMPVEGAFDPKTFTRSDINVGLVLDSFEPALVLTSQGSPNNLEKEFVQRAIWRGIPTAVISDIHGSGLRTGLSLNEPSLDTVLFTTLDSEDSRLIREHFQGPVKPKIVETGSPAFDKFDGKMGFAKYLARIASPFPRVFHILGQDDSTTDFLAGALQTADSFEGSLAIVGLHPKFLSNPELCSKWFGIVRSSKTMVIWGNSLATTLQYMASSTYVVSGYSTGLIEAGLIANNLGPIAVSWVSPLVRQRMAESLGGLTTFPTVTYGGAIEVASVEEFREKVPDPGTKAFREFRESAREALRTRLHVDGKATERIVTAIREHAGL